MATSAAKLVVFASLTLAAVVAQETSPLSTASFALQPNVDFRGQNLPNGRIDYAQGLTMADATERCATDCLQLVNCVAFTVVGEGFFNPTSNAACFRKSSIPVGTPRLPADVLMVSGARQPTDRVLVLDTSSVSIAPLTLTGDCTISVWVKLDAGISNADAVVGSAAQNINFHLGLLRLYNGSGNVAITRIAAKANVWTHYSFVRSGTVTSSYVNGVFQSSTPGWGGDFVIDRIGGGVTAAGFSGQLDNLHIWTAARTVAQVQDEMNGMLGNISTLSRNYSFDGTVNQIVDDTGGSPASPVSEGVEVVGRADRVLQLDATSVSIESITLAGDFSISVWVNLDEGISNTDAIVGSDQQNVNFHRGLLRLYNGASNVAVTRRAAEAGVWTHYSFVRSDAVSSIYIDGVLDGLSSGWLGEFVIDRIGAPVNVNGGLDGRIDNLNIWSEARTVAQLEEEINGRLGNTAGLLRSYSFDGTGSTAQIVDETENSSSIPLFRGTALISRARPSSSIVGTGPDSAPVPPPIPPVAPAPVAGPVPTPTPTFAPTPTQSRRVADRNGPSDRVLQLDTTRINLQALTLTGDFSISVWVNLDGGISNDDSILGSNRQNINFHQGLLRLYNGASNVATTSRAAEAGVWTHYSFVRSGDVSSIYIDGVLDGSTSGWTGAFLVDRIGAGVNARGFDGQMDDLYIWSEARSVNEIVLEQNGDLGNTAALIRRYSFDGGANQISDDTGNSVPVPLPSGATLAYRNQVLRLDTATVGIDPVTLTGDFAISVWLSLNEGISNADAVVGSNRQNINFHQGLLRLYNGAGNVAITSSTAEAGVWRHYAIVRSGVVTSSYINGVLNSSTSGWTGSFLVDRIGGGVNAAGFDGQIDELHIWSEARSVDQIASEMVGVLGGTTALERNYSFDGSDSFVADETGNGSPASLPQRAIIIGVNQEVLEVPTLPPQPTGPSRALALDGDRLLIDTVVLAGDFTFSSWVLFASNFVEEAGLFTGGSFSTDFRDSLLRIFRSNGSDILVANTPVVSGEWVHISIARENGVIRFYLNGNFDVSTTSQALHFRDPTPLPVNDPFSLSDLFSGLEGQVDDVQIWTVARSQTDIQSDLTSDLQDTVGLLRRYTFSNQNNQVVDDTGNSLPLPLPAGGEFVASSAPLAIPRSSNQFTDTQVATDFFLPVDIAFLPDGRMLVLEQAGVVKIVEDPTRPGSDVQTYLDIRAITDSQSERGLLAVAVDPNFGLNGYLYFFHTLLEGDVPKTTVSRYTHVNNQGGTTSRANPASATVLFQELDRARTGTHIGGGLAIAHEQIDNNDPSPYKLYIVLSDDSGPARSADLTSDDGKVHRINLTDGSIPRDNPYFDAAVAASYTPWIDTTTAVSRSPANLALDLEGVITTIYSRGIRNGFRASYDQESRNLFIGEIGAGRTSHEDIHVATPGVNHGWPQRTGPLANPNDPGNPIHSYLRTDYLPNGNDLGASVTGGVVYRGNMFPSEFQGAYFYGDWSQNWIRYLTLDTSGGRPEVTSDNFFKFTAGRILSFEQGPDGALYYVTGFQTGTVFSFEGVVNRLSFDSENRGPVGEGIVIPNGQDSSTSVPHTVSFRADVRDPDGDALTYLWSFGDGNNAVSSAATPTHTYTSAGSYQVDLTVTDSKGASVAFSPQSIQVGNAPVPVISGVANGGTFRAGQTFTVAADVTDVEDGRLPNSALTWGSAFFLDAVGRPGPFEEQSAAAGGVTFTTPSTGQVESFLNAMSIFLTAVDSDGLSTTTEVRLSADQVTLRFVGPIAAAAFFIFDGQTQPSDYSFDSTIGFNHQIEAPQTVTNTNGVDLAFSRWSDGVTSRVRSFVTPENDTTFRPLYI